MGDNNKKYSGFGYVVNPIRIWYNIYYYYSININCCQGNLTSRKELQENEKKFTKIPYEDQIDVGCDFPICDLVNILLLVLQKF